MSRYKDVLFLFYFFVLQLGPAAQGICHLGVSVCLSGWMGGWMATAMHGVGGLGQVQVGLPTYLWPTSGLQIDLPLACDVKWLPARHRRRVE